jgi:hypothetical protein
MMRDGNGQRTASTLSHLEGSLSGATYPADGLMNVDPTDGRPLLARYDLERAVGTLTAESLALRRAGGMWRWAELLPVRGRDRVVSLGEGTRRCWRSPGSETASASLAFRRRPRV